MITKLPHMRSLRERTRLVTDLLQHSQELLSQCFQRNRMSSVKRKIPPEKWTLVTKVLMSKVLLLRAGVGPCKKMVLCIKQNLRNTKHCQPWKIRFNLESQHTGVFFCFKFFLFNHICYKYSIEVHFSRAEMVFNKASHVWLCSQAFSCLVSCQDVRVSFPKVIICDSA